MRLALSRILLCIALAGALPLAACAARSERVAAELTELGLSPSLAGCLGERLADDLSDRQLRQLGRALEAYRSAAATDGLSLAGLARAAGEIEDLESVGVVTRSGLACGLRQA